MGLWSYPVGCLDVDISSRDGWMFCGISIWARMICQAEWMGISVSASGMSLLKTIGGEVKGSKTVHKNGDEPVGTGESRKGCHSYNGPESSLRIINLPDSVPRVAFRSAVGQVSRLGHSGGYNSFSGVVSLGCLSLYTSSPGQCIQPNTQPPPSLLAVFLTAGSVNAALYPKNIFIVLKRLIIPSLLGASSAYKAYPKPDATCIIYITLSLTITIPYPPHIILAPVVQRLHYAIHLYLTATPSHCYPRHPIG
nr:hypothetical protein L203_04749 [Cryptococcus depauperatus CBS 7841]